LKDAASAAYARLRRCFTSSTAMTPSPGGRPSRT